MSKSFTVELRDISCSDFWIFATVHYEDGHVYEIEDEWKRIHSLESLSQHDRAIVENKLNAWSDEQAVRYL